MMNTRSLLGVLIFDFRTKINLRYNKPFQESTPVTDMWEQTSRYRPARQWTRTHLQYTNQPEGGSVAFETDQKRNLKVCFIRRFLRWFFIIKLARLRVFTAISSTYK